MLRAWSGRVGGGPKRWSCGKAGLGPSGRLRSRDWRLRAPMRNAFQAAQERWRLAALRGHVLIQASGNLDEQTGQQIAVGLNVAELGEHPLDGRAGVLVPPPHFVSQGLGFVAQAFGEFPLKGGKLVGNLAEAFLQSLDLFAQAASQLLVRFGAQILFLANLARRSIPSAS